MPLALAASLLLNTNGFSEFLLFFLPEGFQYSPGDIVLFKVHLSPSDRVVVPTLIPTLHSDRAVGAHTHRSV